MPDFIVMREIQLFGKFCIGFQHFENAHLTVGIHVPVRQFFVKPGELVNVVIDALFFYVGAAALNALDDLLFRKQLQRLSHRDATHVECLLEAGFRR